MKHHNLISLIILFIITSSAVFAQYGLQASFIKPSGDFGYYFKPTVGIEFVFNDGEIDDRFKWGASVGYYELNSRKDTFFSFSSSNFSTGPVIQGYDIFYYYRVVPLQLSATYKLMDTDLSLIIGLDVGANIVSFHKVSYVENTSYLNETNTTLLCGLFPRVGASYELNQQYLISASLGKSYNLDFSEIEIIGLWKLQASLVYYFN